MRESIKEYFNFSKKETIAILIISCITILFAVLPAFIKPSNNKPLSIDTAWVNKINMLLDTHGTYTKIRYKTYNKLYDNDTTTTFNPYNFDPNTIDSVGWRNMGLKAKTIHQILNYTSKGGKFKSDRKSVV